MRINAKSNLYPENVREAIDTARIRYGQDIWLDDDRGVTCGERWAMSFHCHSENGKYTSGRSDNPCGYRAASWTAWGYVIAHLFNIDPSAHIGHYHGVTDFIAQVMHARKTYENRQALGMRARAGEPGQDIFFLVTLSMIDDEQKDNLRCSLYGLDWKGN